MAISFKESPWYIQALVFVGGTWAAVKLATDHLLYQNATSDASGKLAERSRSWASDLRASLASSDTGEPAGGPRPTTPPAASPEDASTPTDGALPG